MVERGRLRITGENLFSNRVIREDGIGTGNGNQVIGPGFVDLARRSGVIGLRVLNFITGDQCQSVTSTPVVESQPFLISDIGNRFDNALNPLASVIFHFNLFVCNFCTNN